MSILTALVLLAVGASRIAHAVPVQQDDALRAAGGWVALSGRPLGEALGIPLGKAVRSLDETGRALFYHVPLRGGGFIILSTDDRLPPVVAFSATGEFVDDPEHPPAAVLRAGTARRLGFLDPPRQDANVALGTVAPNGDALKRREAEARGAWRRLLDAAGESAPVHILGLAWVSDLRVAPIMQTAWSQSMANGQNTYNYYTPNNYPAGCVATAMAQVMRVHRFPVEGIGVHARTIYVNGSGRSASTRGGDGVGGPYLWDNMPLRPAEGATEVERQAVGALCYDAGVTVEMEYTASGSTASLTDAASAMQTVFGYGDANVIFVSPRYDFQPELLPHAINANLDARLPVMLGITTAYGSHAVVCDGYGFEGGSPYHHVNMGYGGADDLWYAFVDFSPSYTIVYNLDPAGSGEIISGRVWDEGGEPLSGVSVHIGALSATTDAKGIYAVTQVAPGTQTVVAEAAGRLPSSVATEVVASVDHVTCGNQYGVDFILKPEGFTGLPEPTSVAATDGDFSDRVEITWAAVAGATHYRVHRSESAGGDRAALGAWRSATSLSDTDVVAAVTYRYWVQAAASAAGDQASALSLSDCGYADNIYSGGSGTEQDPYRIASRRDLLALAENPDDYNLHFLLTDDIDLGDMVLQTALIAPDMDGSTSDNFEGTAFTGTFDGDGHVIRNLTIYTEEGDFLGLFGHLSGSGSAISRLGVEGLSIVGGDDGWAVGGLCARLDNGIIRECYARVALTPGSRTWHAGGLCGVIDDGASIEDCFVDGTLSGGTPAYYTGGLCGCNSYGSIRRSYACVEMTLGSGSAAVGGFCGDNWYGTIQSCFWDTTVSGMSSSDGGTGKTTTQMLQQSTFTSVGWDFDTTWQMADYPALACFPPATGYDAWAESRGIPIDQRAFDAAPAGDGVANLLKYASGLPPMQSCETADLMQPQPAAGEALFRVRYFVSSTATDVLLQPVACASLSGPWLTDSVLTTLVSESDGRQTWEATVLLGDSCGFVRLRATGTDGLSDTDSLFGRCGYAPSATGTEGRFHGGGGSRSGVEASR